MELNEMFSICLKHRSCSGCKLRFRRCMVKEVCGGQKPLDYDLLLHTPIIKGSVSDFQIYYSIEELLDK